jgi:hypothetical protein
MKKDIDITKMSFKELDEFIKFLKETTEELKTDNDRWEQEKVLKDLYHENP